MSPVFRDIYSVAFLPSCMVNFIIDLAPNEASLIAVLTAAVKTSADQYWLSAAKTCAFDQTTSPVCTASCLYDKTSVCRSGQDFI